jgi:hypothetical protein
MVQSFSVVLLATNAAGRREFSSGAPGKKPCFHVFVADVVARFDLTASLTSFRANAFLSGAKVNGVRDEQVAVACIRHRNIYNRIACGKGICVMAGWAARVVCSAGFGALVRRWRRE